MKNTFLFYFFFCFLSLFSQDKIVLKNGSTIIPKQGSIDVVITDKRVQYTLPDKKWNKYIKFSEFDYAIIGSSKLQYFTLEDPDTKKMRSYVYLVLIETPKLKLINLRIKYTGNVGSYTSDYCYIIDNNNVILANIGYSESNNKRQNNSKQLALENIQNYFKDNKYEMEKLNNAISGQKTPELGVQKYLTDDTYRKYN
jgi:hypothetical protein